MTFPGNKSLYEWIRGGLFKMDPEAAHDLILGLIGAAGKLPPLGGILKEFYQPSSSAPVPFAGLSFPNPVGLAAGYDKNGSAWKGLACLGFGHIELGTVTPLPQIGNPKPRIFRLPEQEAIINRMGFPGKGVEHVLKEVPEKGTSAARKGIILGINIGKNKDTPNEEAVRDYLFCLRRLASRADYFAINVSSPNTIGLRKLQGKEYLQRLVKELVTERDRIRKELNRPLPVLVKISPDLTDGELDDALEEILDGRADGVIAANTTIQRTPYLPTDPGIQGGLSGNPIWELNKSLVSKIHRRTGGVLPIIGVGGINSVESARDIMKAGASLVQVYSGLIYQGPNLVRRLVEGLSG